MWSSHGGRLGGEGGKGDDGGPKERKGGRALDELEEGRERNEKRH